MSFVHGKGSVVSLDGDDLSVYGTAVEFGRTADVHDVTTFGKNAHVKQGGLLNGTATITGIYDNTAVVSPRLVIEPLIGTTVPLVWRPEGAGAGKPEDTVDVVVAGYTESSPVADMITWTAALELSDDVVTAAQGA